MKISLAVQDFIRSIGSPHAGHFHPDLELQIDPVDEERRFESGIMCSIFKIRLPESGDSDPVDNDGEMPFPMEVVQRFGTSGWNWRKRQTEFVIFDFDVQEGHKKKSLTPDELQQIQEVASRLPYVTVHRSKGGKGRHFYVELETPIPTANRKEHARVARAILAKMAADCGIDFVAKSDAKGVIGWIWDRDAAANGFELVKAAERKLPSSDVPDWKTTAADNSDEFDAVELDDKHNELILWLTTRGLGEWDVTKHRLNTHTHALKQAHESLGLAGKFETIATGKDGSGDRNCFCHPRPKGAWFVCRFSQGAQEAETWRASPNGWTCCDFNKRPEKYKKGEDDERLIGMTEKTDDLFCSHDGRAFVTFNDEGSSFTLMVEEEDYQDCLRRRFRKRFTRPIGMTYLNNAVKHLRAIAKNGSQHPVGVRVAAHEGHIYIDLCNPKGQVVEVTADGWHVADKAPVRFRRTRTMAALPLPQHGKINLLRPFCHVTDEDWPLVVGWLVAAFRPERPFTILSFEGRAGSAKSTMARVCKMLIDPSTTDLTGEPSNIEDLMLQAFKSWVVAYDNLSQLDQKMSDALCRVSTGGSLVRRKLFTPEDQTTFSVKNPVVLSSVKGVITARDLVDRAILITLPSFKPGEDRLSENTLWANFKQSYPAIFGALLDGVSAALRNLPTVEVAELIRMADFAEWVTAAEPGVGFSAGTIMEAYKRMRVGAATMVLDNPLGKRLMELAKENWEGTAKELSEALGEGKWPKDAKALAGEVRLLAPDLEKLGMTISDRILNGRTNFYLSMAQMTCYDNSEAGELWLEMLMDTVNEYVPFLKSLGVQVQIDGERLSLSRS
jgi:hypothetical protein